MNAFETEFLAECETDFRTFHAIAKRFPVRAAEQLETWAELKATAAPDACAWALEAAQIVRTQMERAKLVKAEGEEIQLVGQPAAQEELQSSLDFYKRHKRFHSAIFIKAESGVGKTFAACLFLEELEKLGVRTVNIDSASKLAVLNSPDSEALRNALTDSANGIPTAIFIDECHLIKKASIASRRIFDSVIMGSGQGWGRTGELEINKEIVPYNTHNLCFILATNKDIISSNRTAQDRRFTIVRLELYGSAVMRQITVNYFENKGIEVTDEALLDLVKLHRGSLVALECITKGLKLVEGDILTEEMLADYLPSCDYQLRGFTKLEIRALKWLATTSEPRTDRLLAKHFPELEIDELYRHCQRQETLIKDSDRLMLTPFLTMGRTDYDVTAVCKTYLTKNKTKFNNI